MNILVTCLLLAVPLLPAQDFVSIFDGKTLEGWKPISPTFWSVEEGAITAQSSETNPCTANEYIVWEGGDVEDFDIKMQVRFVGATANRNSGIQFRSRMAPNGRAVGYQADIIPGGPWCGAVCDEEATRTALLTRNGEKTEIDRAGNRSVWLLGPAVQMKDDWNEYHVSARGSHIAVRINGALASELIDLEEGQADRKGILGMQLRRGAPMKVQFKDIQLRKLLPTLKPTSGAEPTTPAPSVTPADPNLPEGFVSLFDGKTLGGWGSRQLEFWSVEDEALTCESTPERPCTQNQFLVWQDGDVADFELEAKFRLANNRGNSGIQFRSVISLEGNGVGYQADILPGGDWLGALCDEHATRRKVMLATNGSKVEIDAQGERTVSRLGPRVTLRTQGEWNDYRILAKGNRIQFWVNGEPSIDVLDLQEQLFRSKGILALQLRSGVPMKAQFKDLYLRRF